MAGRFGMRFKLQLLLQRYDAKSGEKPVLGAKQFAAVALASREFDLYLKETQRGKDDAQLAQEEKSRTDNWGDYNRDSGFIEQGVVYVPQAARAQHSNGLSPTVVRRSNKPGPGNKQDNKGEISDDDDLTDDTSSATDEDEEDSEADISPHSRNSGNEAVGSSEHEEEETDEGEKEAEEPISPAKPVKIRAKRTSKDKLKASSSNNSEKINKDEENDDGEVDHKAKKKGKGLSSKPHKI